MVVIQHGHAPLGQGLELTSDSTMMVDVKEHLLENLLKSGPIHMHDCWFLLSKIIFEVEDFSPLNFKTVFKKFVL